MKLKRILCTVLCALLLVSPVQVFASTLYVSDSQIVSCKTPVSAADTELAWAVKLGSSYKDAPSPQVVVGDTLIVMSNKKLLKLNVKNGKTVKSTDMVDMPSYSYTPPVYANGVIYCPLDNAKIQAFDYKTMKSLWVYSDPLGGQSLTPITYSDGCIYTGFWNDEDRKANYVCINVTDENKKETHEAKKATWTYTSLGGFYWAGCAAVGGNVVFGCDDGTIYANKNSKAVSINKKTGKLVDTLPIVGDQRSSMTYQNGTLYFTTKAGYLYSVKLNANGTFNDSSVKRLSLGGASTSTPLIYNGRLYLGVQGKGFGAGYFKVIDANRLTVIYSAQTKGYPQGKFLLSDAYLKDTGKVNIYITYNCAPGGVTVFKDSAGQTVADMQELYTPTGEKSNYCISSIVTGENGTIFYKNDSGYIFALRNKTKKISFFKRIINAIVSFFKKLFG